MIDEQDAQIFKSHDDYARNKRKFIQYLKYAETWQSASVICSYAAFLCDILLIATFILSTSMSGIPPTKANPIGRMFSPLLQSIFQKKIK